ncbi:MAG: dihydrolipoyl dehydrogenase family protein, partial [Cyclobacteriaceae bacterium]
MDFDVTVIGSGPGGYVAAIRCAQLGMKTALVEKYDTLGGTCLNVGCIPSKALLDSSEHFHNAETNFKVHGINLSNLKVDLPQMIERKRGVVKQTVDGISYLMKKNKITVHHGMGSFKDKNTIVVTGQDNKKTEFTTKNVIIATGSKPASLPFIKIDKKRIITSTEALELQQIPKHLMIIGGGYIGLELGSVYARLGAKVTVLEYAERIAPLVDITMSKELMKSLKKLKFDFKLRHKVTSVENTGKEVVVKAEDKKGEEVEVKGDICLVSVGRKPYTDGLGLENIGLEVNKQGKIEVDDHLKTKIDNIYAI